MNLIFMRKKYMIILYKGIPQVLLMKKGGFEMM